MPSGLLPSTINDLLGDEGEGGKLTWVFSRNLAKKTHDFFHPLAFEHLLFSEHYSLLRTGLARTLAPKKNEIEPLSKEAIEKDMENLIRQLVAALEMAEVLIRIYSKKDGYLGGINAEIDRLQKEQAIYRKLLGLRGYQFTEEAEQEDVGDFFFTGTLREAMFILNVPRLLTMRIRRVLVTLVPVINLRNYGKFIDYLDPYFARPLAYLAWLFFIPRLVMTTFLLAKHSFSHRWMNDNEKSLGWLGRLQIRLQRNWFELINDPAYVTGGLIGCFVLVGVLGPIGLYITTTLFSLDIVLAGVRAYIELGRLDRLRTEYQAKADTIRQKSEQTAEEQAQLAEIEDYLSDLKQRLIYERMRLLLPVISASGLFLASLLAIPAIVIIPLPLVAAILIVLITLATNVAQGLILSQKPPDKINGDLYKEGVERLSTSRYAMFQNPSNDRPHEPSSKLSSSSSLVLSPNSSSEKLDGKTVS